MSKKNNPKLRADAKLTQIDGSTYELVHPETDSTLRLDSIGYLVAEQFEKGEFSIEEAINNLKKNYGIRMTRDELLDFLTKAKSLDLLESLPEEISLPKSVQIESEIEFMPQVKLSAAKEVKKIQEQATQRFSWVRNLSRKAIFTIACGVILFIFPWKEKARGPVVIEPFYHATVRSVVSGRIEEIFVREGQDVKPNQPIARLEGFTDDIARKQSEISKVEAELQKLKTGATKEELNEVQKKFELARKIASQAGAKARRYKRLKNKGLISQNEYEEVLAENVIREKELEKAQAELTLIKRGTRPEIVRAKQAEKEALLVDLKQLENLNERSLIHSPIGGIVATPETRKLIGRKVEPGDSIVEIANPNRITVQTYIQEQDIAKISISQKILFKVQAMPHQTFQGKISRIAPMAETGEVLGGSTSKKYFRIYADIDNPSFQLKPGMTGTGQVSLGWKLLGLTYFDDFIRKVRVYFVI